MVEQSLSDKIDSPFIVPLKAFFQRPKKNYIVSPLISGAHLFDRLRQENRFGPSEARFYAGQLVWVLDYLHDLDIVYGSLRPHNILFDYAGYLVVADFRLFIKGLSGKKHNMTPRSQFCANTP